MNDFGQKRPISEDTLCVSTDTVKAKRGRPKKMIEQDTEDYYFYGTDESIILSKDKLNDNPPEIVKCGVNRSEDGPNQIAVYDDQLFAMSKHFPGLLDEVDGLSAFIGIIADEKTIVIHIA